MGPQREKWNEESLFFQIGEKNMFINLKYDSVEKKK